MTARSSSLLALLSSFLLACGSAPARPAETAPTPAPVAVAPAPTVPAEAWVVVPMRPGFGSSGDLPRLPDDGAGMVFVFGGVRTHFDGHEWHVARETTWAWIEGMAHLGDDWIFVTHAGEVFRSAHDPIGDLTFVGTLGGQALLHGATTRYRLTMIDAQGALFFGDASSVTRVEGLTQPVTAVAFATATFGARLDADGSISRTTDGGATWSALSLPRGAHAHWLGIDPNDPTRLRAGEDRFSPSFLQITESGAPTRGHDAHIGAPTPEGERESDLEGEGIRFAARGQRWVTGLARDHRWIGDNGEDGGERATFVMPAAVPIHWTETCGGHVGYSVWGAQLVGSCPESSSTEAPTTYWTIGADGTTTRLGEGLTDPHVFFDPDGERYVSHAGCSTEHCLTGPHGTTPIDVPAGGRVAAIHGDRLIVQYPDHAISVQLSTGVVSPTPFVNELMEVRLAADGTLWARNQLQLLIGEDLHEVGRSNRAYVVDAQHIAVQVMDEIRVSADGGATFTAVPRLGGAVTHELEPFRCGAWGCNFGDVLWAVQSVADALGAHMISAPRGT